MKRYLVFAFDDYDASGGMNDFKEDFDCLESACEELKKQVTDGYSGHVWDSEERKIVFELNMPSVNLSFFDAVFTNKPMVLDDVFRAEIEGRLTQYYKDSMDNYAIAE